VSNTRKTRPDPARDVRDLAGALAGTVVDAGTGPPADADVAAVQAAVEGVPAGDDQTVEFMGETFRIADHIGLMPLLKFAHASARGRSSGDMEGMAALYAMIRDCIWPGEPACGDCGTCRDPATVPAQCPSYVPGDWDRFERTAIDKRAEDTDLL